jgi:hypothetical protein
MKKALWIVGLAFALLVFGGWTVLVIYAGLSRGHLNSKGIIMLICDGYTAWFLYSELRQMVRAHRVPTDSKLEDCTLR